MTATRSRTAPLSGRIAIGGAGYSIDLRGRSWDADVATVRYALDAGITMIDSARAYAPADDPGHNERLFAEALAGREDVLIATKGGHYRSSERSWAVDNSPQRLRADVEASRHNFGVDVLDLFYVHRMDDETDLRPILDELESLRSSGRVARVGLSNVTTEQLEQALRSTVIDAVQNRHSASALESLDVLQACERHGIPFFAYSPVRPVQGSALDADFPTVTALCTQRGIGIHTALLAILLSSSPMMSVVSGASRRESIHGTIAAGSLVVDDDLRTAYLEDLDRRGIQAERAG